MRNFYIDKKNRNKLNDQIKFIRKNLPNKFIIDNDGFIYSPTPYKEFTIIFGKVISGPLYDWLVSNNREYTLLYDNYIKDYLEDKEDVEITYNDDSGLIYANNENRGKSIIGETNDNISDSLYSDIRVLKDLDINLDNAVPITQDMIGNKIKINNFEIVLTNFCFAGNIKTSKMWCVPNTDERLYELKEIKMNDKLLFVNFVHHRANIEMVTSLVVIDV